MSRQSRPPRSRTDRGRLISVLVPGPIGRLPPSPPPLPALPSLRLPTDADPDAALLDLVRLDRSGRVHARPLLDALGWGAAAEAEALSDGIPPPSTWPPAWLTTAYAAAL